MGGIERVEQHPTPKEGREAKRQSLGDRVEKDQLHPPLVAGDIDEDDARRFAVFNCVNPPIRLPRAVLNEWFEQGLITAEDVTELAQEKSE
ncbi:hypothetical protein HYU96_00720 [Candidatus Daviesbacteria bacterium]|nr:hypothetical protein [Candidatus Daviesbacteria bacterium]